MSTKLHTTDRKMTHIRVDRQTEGRERGQMIISGRQWMGRQMGN